MPVLGTKLHVPSPRRELVARDRLTDRLRSAGGPAPRLVLISAPAGFGKTTLMAQWLSTPSAADGLAPRVAWLSLDEADSEVGRFLTHLVASIRAAQPDVGAMDLESAASTGVGDALVALHEQTRLLGRQFCAGLGNGILLGYLMWHSRLLPRPMVMFGLIGGPMVLVAGIGALLGTWDSGSGLPVALTAPEAIWELSLTVWLLVKGFRPSPVLAGRPIVRELAERP